MDNYNVTFLPSLLSLDGNREGCDLSTFLVILTVVAKWITIQCDLLTILVIPDSRFIVLDGRSLLPY